MIWGTSSLTPSQPSGTTSMMQLCFECVEISICLVQPVLPRAILVWSPWAYLSLMTTLQQAGTSRSPIKIKGIGCTGDHSRSSSIVTNPLAWLTDLSAVTSISITRACGRSKTLTKASTSLLSTMVVWGPTLRFTVA